MKIKQDKNDSSNNEENTAKSPAQRSPLSLFFMGATFCAVELTSALPYFGFLTLLAGYNLTVPFVFSYLLLYCFMYVLPLLVLYVGYNKLRGDGDHSAFRRDVAACFVLHCSRCLMSSGDFAAISWRQFSCLRHRKSMHATS